jgi:hypothetical protein
MDRQPDGIGAVSADLHRRGAGCTVLCLAAHRPTDRSLQPGEVCAIPQVRTTYKLIFWFVAVLVLVALGFPYVMPFFY